jgi:hypothetical protein
MKLTIVIPYRDRSENLSYFLEETPKKINSEFDILIVEQFDEKLFNKGKLLNIGFDIKKNYSDYFCFHDVDMIPIYADYSYSEIPVNLTSNIEQFNNGIPYEEYYGGVNLFNNKDFLKINGYSNEYWGWGCEDDDLLNRVKSHGFDLNRRLGVFKSLEHLNMRFNNPNYNSNLEKLTNIYDFQTDGLNTLNYDVIDIINIDSNVNMIKVSI